MLSIYLFHTYINVQHQHLDLCVLHWFPWSIFKCQQWTRTISRRRGRRGRNSCVGLLPHSKCKFHHLHAASCLCSLLALVWLLASPSHLGCSNCHQKIRHRKSSAATLFLVKKQKQLLHLPCTFSQYRCVPQKVHQ